MLKLIQDDSQKIGRNDPCPCGSGQKFKKCCLSKSEQKQLGAVPGAPASRIEVERMMGKIGKILEHKSDSLSIEELNSQFTGKSFDEIDAEYDSIFGAAQTLKRKAEELLDPAFDEPSALRRITLAQRALEIYPGLADAWVILAHDKAKDCCEAIRYFEKAVEMGKKDLGEEFFTENSGHFWGMMESRPYMRAKAYLADALAAHDRVDEAITHYEDCLKLNPNDNQGVRYELLTLYLLKNSMLDAEKLFKKYKDDCGAAWDYSKALYLFKKHGSESIKAVKQLNEARKSNKYVLEYFTGKKKLPKTIPSSYALGSKEEAIIYACDGFIAWKATPGALEWLKEWV